MRGRRLKPAAALLGTALLFFFFSELFFYNEFAALPLVTGNATQALEHSVAMTGFYVAFALPFLTALAWFNIRTLSGLFLAGCLYGWACEGAIIPQVYEAPPFSFLWTAISWHGLVDAMIAFWLLPLALARGIWPTLGLALGLGLFWGYWLTWPGDSPEALPPEAAFRYTALASLPLFLGLACLSYAEDAAWRFPKWPGLIGSLCLLPFAAIMGAGQPVAALGLAALVLVTLLSLRLEPRLTSTTPGASYPAARWHWMTLGLLPPAAALTYLAATATG